LRIDRAILFVWQASPGWTMLSFCLTIVQGILPLLTLYILKLIIDAVTSAIQSGETSTSGSQIIYLIVLTAGLAISQAALRSAAAYVSEAQGTIITDHVSKTIQEKSISLDLSYYENPRYQDTLHRAQQEGPYRPTQIVNGLISLIQNAVSLVAMVGLLFLFHWSVGLLLFVSILPGLAIQIVYARKRFSLQEKWTPDERRAEYFNAVLTHDVFAKEVRLFDLGDYFSTSFAAIRASLRGEKLGLRKGNALAEFVGQSFAIIILMGCLAFIALRALSGAITLGDMVMFFGAFQRGTEYLKGLLSSVASLYEDNMFVAHFFEFLDIENQIKEPANPQKLPSRAEKGITFENVTFRYPGEPDDVLINVSLSINPGEIVALVGANGAGKSTLIKLLCRLYDPQQGIVKIEGIPLPELSIKAIRERISAVFQDYARYFLTVKENIWLGDTGIAADLERIKEAAGKAGAAQFIEKLPNGYDTILGHWFDSGKELSLGEWQKIVLARAFIKESRLLILDEPTSSLDAYTEYYLNNKLKELLADRSALLISHRFSTISMADRIYVLDNGRIAEHGSHDELIAKNGVYADMYRKHLSCNRFE